MTREVNSRLWQGPKDRLSFDTRQSDGAQASRRPYAHRARAINEIIAVESQSG